MIDDYADAQANHSEEEIIDLCCGAIHTENSFIKSHPRALEFILYYDELSFSNPLGAEASKNKFGVLYFTLANFPPHIRSHLDFIFLLGLAQANDVKGELIENLLKPLVAELKTFANGLHLGLEHNTRLFFGYPFIFVGDTPALNHLFGIKEGVCSSFRKCRQGFASRNDFGSKFDINLFKKRNVEEHIVEAMQVEMESGTNNSSTSKEEGITRLNSLFQLANVCNCNPFTQAPDDLMHVLFEGIVPCYEIIF